MIGDLAFSSCQVDEIRDGIIKLRDVALENTQMEWAVLLSHTVAILALVVKDMNNVGDPSKMA